MKVTIRLFASFREVAGKSEDVLEVPPGTTVGQLWTKLQEDHPRLRPWGGVSAFALNGTYTRPAAPLSNGDEVAFIPPVSGG